MKKSSQNKYNTHSYIYIYKKMKLPFVALKLEPVIVLLNKIILTFEMKRIAIRVQHKSFIGIFLEQRN